MLYSYRVQDLQEKAHVVPEVWDSTWSADPSSGHHHHPFILLVLDVLSNVLQSPLRDGRASTTRENPSAAVPHSACLRRSKESA